MQVAHTPQQTLSLIKVMLAVTLQMSVCTFHLCEVLQASELWLPAGRTRKS